MQISGSKHHVLLHGLVHFQKLLLQKRENCLNNDALSLLDCPIWCRSSSSCCEKETYEYAHACFMMNSGEKFADFTRICTSPPRGTITGTVMRCSVLGTQGTPSNYSQGFIRNNMDYRMTQFMRELDCQLQASAFNTFGWMIWYSLIIFV